PPTVNNGSGGVFHYNPFLHCLEMRAIIEKGLWERIQEHFGTEGFLVGLSSIYWREAWKYGERAFRYCQLDIGHAMVCMSLAANLMGWRSMYLNSLSDKDVAIILGFDKTTWREGEMEYPQLLLFIFNDKGKEIPRYIPQDIIDSFEEIPFYGKPNLLSKEHTEWKAIIDVSSMTEKPKTPEEKYLYKEHLSKWQGIPRKAVEIIRQRRSAQAYDGETGIDKKDFFNMLSRIMPRNNSTPFDLELGDVSIHLLIFVHIVYDLEPGLYFLLRKEEDYQVIKNRFNSDFLWEKVTEDFPFYLLKKGDFRSEAAFASCNQDIARDGAFSLSMIARFKENIQERPFSYRHLHWEAGMVGQVLYLEAEAHSMRGTAMGCFFDDVVHKIANLEDNSFQDIYHFAIGKAIEDKRLSTLPPYHHLTRKY
ncbi:MAG: SagB/ThcOx family dehydrogenase, partial [Thermodesulfovibrionales bacterium]